MLLERGAVPHWRRCSSARRRRCTATAPSPPPPPPSTTIEEVDADGETASDETGAAAEAAAAAAGDDEEDEQELAEEKESPLSAVARRGVRAEPRGARDLCEAGALPVLAPHRARRQQRAGQRRACVADSARDEKALAILGALPALVPKLLAIAHNGSGQAQKNSAIALGRLAKNPHCLKAIRDNNGIEILARSMSKMGMAPGGR